MLSPCLDPLPSFKFSLVLHMWSCRTDFIFQTFLKIKYYVCQINIIAFLQCSASDLFLCFLKLFVVHVTQLQYGGSEIPHGRVCLRSTDLDCDQALQLLRTIFESGRQLISSLSATNQPCLSWFIQVKVC